MGLHTVVQALRQKLRRTKAGRPEAGTLAAPRVLFVDDQLPLPTLGAGNPRACRLLHELQRAGARTTHYPLGVPEPDMAGAAKVLPAGLELIVGKDRPALAPFLQERCGQYDLVLVSRPHNMRQFLACCDEHVPHFLPATRLVYDAEAVVAPRESLRRKVLGLTSEPGAMELLLANEFALARRAATVLAVSEAEARRLRDAGCPDVRVLGHTLMPAPTQSSFDARQGILFVGHLGGDDTPNADSLRWFVQAIMPLLDRLIGNDWQLDLVGDCAPGLRAELESPRVRVHGRVEDPTAHNEGGRLFIAPTRFAAGIPHKAHEAAARGLPMVATRLIAGQLGWKEGAALLAADSPDEFAQACAQLYRNRKLWERVRTDSLAEVARDCDPEAFRRVVRRVLEPAVRRHPLKMRFRALP